MESTTVNKKTQHKGPTGAHAQMTVTTTTTNQMQVHIVVPYVKELGEI